MASDPSSGAATVTVEQKINLGLEEVKDNLSKLLDDQMMMLEILKVLVSYVNKETTGTSFEQFSGYSVLGVHLKSSTATKRLPRKVADGAHILLEPDQLRYCSEVNRFERTHVFKTFQKILERRGEDFDVADVKDDESSEEQEVVSKEYAEHKQIMLDVLLPFCDLLEGILSSEKLKDRFLQTTSMKFEELENIRRNLGVVAAIVKVFHPDKVSSDLKLPAFCGPESFGKSTLINHLVNNGVDVDFMPASPGMGTQVVCKISRGQLESFRMASDTHTARRGNVNDKLNEVNQNIVKLSKKGELGIREMDMFLAERDFYTSVPTELLDVPGIKESTAFHTSLALNIASTLCLVCGQLNYLKTQLAPGGDLNLLVGIVNKIDEDLPIQLIVSFKVEESYFQQNETEYEKLISQTFPGKTILKPMWLNFKTSTLTGEQRAKMAATFMDSVASGIARTVNPYEKFMDCQTDIDRLSRGVHAFISKEVGEYFTKHTEAIRGVKEQIKNYTGAKSPIAEMLKSKLSGVGIRDELQSVVVDRELPKFRVAFGDSETTEVLNPPLIAQGLLIECRLAEMKWLIEKGTELHTDTLGDIYSSILDLSRPQQKDQDANEVMKRMSSAYRFHNTASSKELELKEDGAPDTGRGQKAERQKMAFWSANCCSHVASYLNDGDFRWFVTGFYIVIGDRANYTALMQRLTNQKVKLEVDTVTETLAEALNAVPFMKWVEDCKGKTGDEMMLAQFQAMIEACEAFSEIATKSGLTTDVKNFSMRMLLKYVFEMSERVICFKDPSGDNMEYTAFAKYMKKSAGKPNELRDLKNQLDESVPTENPQLVADLCHQALDLMRSYPSLPSEWREKVNDDLPADLEVMADCIKKLAAPWSQTAANATILVSGSLKSALLAATSGWGSSAPEFPELQAMYAELQGAACKMNLQDAPAKDEEFAGHCCETVSTNGSRVALWFRSPAISSYDPQSKELAVLSRLASQPNLTKVFVLWKPSQDVEWSAEKSETWNIAKTIGRGCFLDVECVSYRNKGDLTNKMADILKAVNTGEKTAEVNKEKLLKDIGDIRKNFTQGVQGFLNAVTGSIDMEAKDFHHWVANDLNDESERLMKSATAKGSKRAKVLYPDKEFMNNQPDFRAVAIGRLDAEAEGESGKIAMVNELVARSFLFNVMLGQVVRDAAELARAAYDSVFKVTLEKMGSKFFMSAENMLEVLDSYIAKTKDEIKRGKGSDAEDAELELSNMQTLRDMLDIEKFQHMYVGCAVYRIMPTLYATVLPPVVDQNKGDADDARVRYHMARAKSMLGQQKEDDWLTMFYNVQDAIFEKVKPYSPFAIV